MAGPTVQQTLKGRSVIFKGRYASLRLTKLIELLPLRSSPHQKAGVFHDFQALPSFQIRPQATQIG